MEEILFILYVRDQRESREFYSRILDISPVLDVPGMTEFSLSGNVKIGIMPEKGIAKIIGDTMPRPETGNGIPRCEIYLKTDHPEKYMERGMQAGGKLISELQQRDWGDTVGYIADPDGHILAFARK